MQKNLNHTKKRCKIIPTCMINVFEEKEKKASVQLKPVKPRGRPKGPFRSEQAVDAQKSRPSSPTLRVATPFDLQEESKRFEKKMKRITRIQDPMNFTTEKTSYERTLWGLTSYNPRDFTSSSLREEYIDEMRPKFRSQVPNIELFDRVGRSYDER